ncbi:hypothetical protein M9H77_23304 [Catharanthus roseus]|uniref:Uncharacterized protein n=1 Tax=Catharanthus roseus TaxID=4058 RepID=A0ACC0ATM7_CATRO|nr:hypothetical protein M9H77_23304 [Catharanthus roseus]
MTFCDKENITENPKYDICSLSEAERKILSKTVSACSGFGERGSLCAKAIITSPLWSQASARVLARKRFQEASMLNLNPPVQCFSGCHAEASLHLFVLDSLKTLEL